MRYEECYMGKLPNSHNMVMLFHFAIQENCPTLQCGEISSPLRTVILPLRNMQKCLVRAPFRFYSSSLSRRRRNSSGRAGMQPCCVQT